MRQEFVFLLGGLTPWAVCIWFPNPLGTSFERIAFASHAPPAVARSLSDWQKRRQIFFHWPLNIEEVKIYEFYIQSFKYRQIWESS